MTKAELTAEIRRFLATRPGFEPGNYSDATSYRADVRSATNARNDAETMLAHIARSESITVDDMVTGLSSRLSLTEGRSLDYTAGQYYCIEYRRAVASWLSSVLWAYWRDHCKCDTRYKIVAEAHRSFRSRRVRGYFS